MRDFKEKIQTFCKDPFVRFSIAGVFLFVLTTGIENLSADNKTIYLHPKLTQQMEAQYRATHGQNPTPIEVQALVNKHVADEALVRQAIAWDLHHSDPIIRRRLIQKVRFMFSGYSGEKITEKDFRSYFEENKESYRVEAKLGFKQVFVSRDSFGENALVEAKKRLAKLRSGQEVQSDPWYLGSPEAVQSISTIAGFFGQDFAASLKKVTHNKWSEPTPSSFGYHIVYIENHKASYIPKLENIKQKVWVNFQRDREDEAFAQFVLETTAQYKVVQSESKADSHVD